MYPSVFTVYVVYTLHAERTWSEPHLKLKRQLRAMSPNLLSEKPDWKCFRTRLQHLANLILLPIAYRFTSVLFITWNGQILYAAGIASTVSDIDSQRYPYVSCTDGTPRANINLHLAGKRNVLFALLMLRRAGAKFREVPCGCYFQSAPCQVVTSQFVLGTHIFGPNHNLSDQIGILT